MGGGGGGVGGCGCTLHRVVKACLLPKARHSPEKIFDFTYYVSIVILLLNYIMLEN